MPKSVVERDVPGAGKRSPAELRSHLAAAPDEQVVGEHAKQGGFPGNRISRVRTVIEPTTAED